MFTTQKPIPPFTKIEDELHALFLEPEENKSLYIIERYEIQKQNYIDFIRKYDQYLISEKDNLEDIISGITHMYDKIIMCVEQFLDGEYEDSTNTFSKTFIDNSSEYTVNHQYMSTFGEARYYFYRVRANQSYTLFSPKEMLHIPFEKRHLTRNERFSSAGYPCLYFGSSIYGCWEETLRPDIDKVNIISLKSITDNPVKLLNLAIPLFRFFKAGKSSLYFLVLSLTSSLPAFNKDANFKPEYIIPQTILKCIIHKNKNEPEQCYGIQYSSTICNQSQDLFKRTELLTNYVIPIVKSKKSGLCDTVTKLFEISPVTTFTNERFTANKRDTFFSDSYKGKYESTEFGVLEEKLQNRVHSLVK